MYSAVLATLTPEELEATLGEHPDLLARLKSGDTSAFEDILESVGGATVGQVTGRLRTMLSAADKRRLEKAFIRQLRDE
jgi:hypothetical protein